MSQKQIRDTSVLLALKDKGINKIHIFRRIKVKHLTRIRRFLRVQVADTTKEMFAALYGPAHFLLAEYLKEGFVYFMEHELSKDQFNEVVATGVPFGIVKKNKFGYTVLWYNHISTNTTTTVQARTTITTSV